MASPGQLVSCVADALGVAVETVTLFDRGLAEAGLRSKGGRGRSAARVSARDAANLLIAVAGSSQIKEAASVTARFEDLVAGFGETQLKEPDVDLTRVGSISGKWQLELLPLDRMQALPEEHTFGQALAALIETSAFGELRGALDLLPEALDPSQKNKCSIRVELMTPRFSASIKFRLRGQFNFYEIHRYEMRPAKATEWTMKEKANAGDLQQRRIFTHKTIRAVGNLISQG